MPALFLELGEGELAAVIDAQQVDANGLFPAGDIADFDRAPFEVAAGVGHDDIDSAEAGAGLGIERLHSAGIADIALDRQSLAASLAYQPRRFVELFLRSRRADDLGAFLREADSQPAPDAAPRASDNRDFACQLSAHVQSSLSFEKLDSLAE